MSTELPRAEHSLGIDGAPLNEITFKAIVLSILLAIVLGAANAYLALKVGKTVAASIPAAVISMGIFRFFRGSSILETNLVQTAASAGEGLASVAAFVMPALLMIGYWQSFNFWQSALLMMVGGTLGVFFSVPLRRVLLGLKTLTFPEGTAVGTVMKASTSKVGNMKRLVQGGVIGGTIELFQTGFNLATDHLPLWIKSGNTLMGLSLGFNPALIGAGYIVGIQAGMAMLLGTFLGWVCGVPMLSWIYGIPVVSGHENMVMSLWSHYIRYIGVGTMLVAGIWTIFTLIKPMVKGMRLAMSAMHDLRKQGGVIPRTETDMRMSYVLWGLGLCLLALLFLVVFLLQGMGLTLSPGLIWSIALVSVAYVIALGFISSLLAGYLVGLIGSSNTPISGLLIINVLFLSLILIPLFGLQVDLSVVIHQKSVLAIIIFVLCVVGFATVITNENIQDLKAGQMVGATPWKQQVMMLVGVFAASLVIAPVLELLFKAYGMGGVFPHPGMDPAQMLPAPQAGLIAAIADGALGHNLPWNLLISGIGIGIFCIFIDEYCKTKNLRLPVLAVGLGIYLPPDLITPVVIGGLASYLVSRSRDKSQALKTATQTTKNEEAQQRGLLAACGLVAGSSLMGVLLAIPFVIAGSSSVLELVSNRFAPWADLIGAVIIFAVCVWLYRVAVDRKQKVL
jgi:putative OPT family oligopeptide transporter